jgi:uncharacterized protein (DUF1697 family)
MGVYVGLLRAVNVGGTGKLAMTELQSACEGVGCTEVSTYIQSGNVVFKSTLNKAKLKPALEQAISKLIGRPALVILRSAKELQKVTERVPFPHAPAPKLIVWFASRPIKATLLKDLTIPGKEEVVALGKEVFVYYPEGIGRSKLKLPIMNEATARNLNTVKRLSEMAASLATRRKTSSQST